MSDEELRQILRDAESKRDPSEWVRLAAALRRSGPTERSGLRASASALDRAYGLAPDDVAIVESRRRALDALAITEHGTRFRYVPEGAFLMGSDEGDPDEHPVHPVFLDGFWISDTPVSWHAFCVMVGWEPPPGLLLRGESPPPIQLPSGRTVQPGRFHPSLEDRVRVLYCEAETLHAGDWHAHWPRAPGAAVPFGFPEPARRNPGSDLRYDE
ncbi:MAG TPA: hypothetical protein VFF73_37590, partial [Planctomycetota bacterium]|nr:hypothetical protein [Planctomycetota bacterium]